ncbi:MAG: hypothetical protein K2X81_21075, partial [Candidatus Obscuribacterales bacterium]|nr:hypothetical protein [Candidatus Obscuribacterales bacterium]
MLLHELASSSLWDTAAQMNLLRDRLNRLVSQAPQSRQADFPPINVWASEQKAVVFAELPGFDPDSIDLQIVNNTLTLKTKREQ